MDGADVCRVHGGRAPQVRAAAERRIAEAKGRRTLADLTSVAVDTSPALDPFGALEDLGQQAVALVDVLRGLVSDLQEVRYRGGPGSGTEQLRGELEAYLSALGRAESIVGRIIALDLEGRRVRLQEAQAGLVVQALARVLSSRQLDLDPQRQRLGRELLARELGASPVVEVPVSREPTGR